MNNVATLSQMTRWKRSNQGYSALALTALFLLAMMVFPELALAQNILDEKANTALDWIKSAVYFILIVAVLGSGVLAAFGRMSWATVGQVLVGAIVAGLATAVVDALYLG